MNNKSIFYSCVTRISYEICQRHYGGMHYAWCSPCLDASSRFSPYNLIPPSSNPKDIYWGLKKDVSVRGMFGLVPPKCRASLFSEEYIIENLPRHLFDVIEL